jgi:hypothetical protein
MMQEIQEKFVKAQSEEHAGNDEEKLEEGQSPRTVPGSEELADMLRGTKLQRSSQLGAP